MRKKIEKYYNSADYKLLNLKEEELESIKKHHLEEVDVTRDEYKNLFEQGLELIRKERLPKALMLEILDQYSERLEELEGVDLSLESLDTHDEATKEKIKSLVLFDKSSSSPKNCSKFSLSTIINFSPLIFCH